MRLHTFCQPIFNRCTSITISSVWWINIYGIAVPLLFQSIFFRQHEFYVCIDN